MSAISPVFFDESPVPPPDGRTEFSLDLWDSIRSRGLPPSYVARLSDDPVKRREFLVGARLMGYELVDLDDHELINRMKAERPPRFPIQPQQLWIADALNAPGYDEYVVEIVRRASKTTTILCLLLGRCASRSGYMVTFSAQNGVKGTARLREWKRRLDAINPPDDLALPPWLRNQQRTPKKRLQAVALFGNDFLPEELSQPAPTSGRGFKIMMGEVGKGIYFDNGSQLLVFKPDAEAYRGEAGDVSWIDEAQEIDPDAADDLLAGISPLQDTRGDDAAIILSGTAGEARVGPFWVRVDDIRTAGRDIGGLDYCAPPDTPWEVIEDEDRAIDLLLTVHPGIGTLTTEETMRKRWRKLNRPQWAREYLSLWPETFGVRAIPSEWWERARLAKRKPIPGRVAFGLDIKPGGSVATICAAWRDARGVAYVEVIAHRPSTAWIPERSKELSAKYRGSTIAYDDIAEGGATAIEIHRQKPKPRLRKQLYREHAAGCVQFERDLQRGRIKHFGQTDLENAVEIAVKREVRGEQGIWMWNSPPGGGDITALVAATRALRNWDQYFDRGAGGATTPIMGD